MAAILDPEGKIVVLNHKIAETVAMFYQFT